MLFTYYVIRRRLEDMGGYSVALTSAKDGSILVMASKSSFAATSCGACVISRQPCRAQPEQVSPSGQLYWIILIHQPTVVNDNRTAAEQFRQGHGCQEGSFWTEDG